MTSGWQDFRRELRGPRNEPPSTARGVFAILVLALVTLPTFAGVAADAGQLSWPQFRGPNSTGIGDGKPPVEFGPDKNVLWKVAIGSGISSPVIAKGRLFLTEFDRDTNQLSTVCINLRTGKLLWRRSVAPAQIEKVHEISSPAAPTPATDGERVYAYFGSYGLVSYDFDGKVQWERRLPLPENIYGAVASPIVAGQLLVLNHQGKEAYLLGVDRRDGRTVWKTDRSRYQYGWSTPVYWHHDGVDEIAVLGGDFQPNQRLMAYNLVDGTERWWVAGLPPCGKSTPVIGGGLLFFAAPDIIMDPAAENANPERAARMYANNASRVVAVKPGGQHEVNQTHVAWSEHKGVLGVSSPLYYNRRLYTFQNGGIVFARNAQTGALVYSGRTGASGYYYSSPVAADNKIYIASEEGVVAVLDAGEQMNVLARNKLDGGILATPAIVDGKLYVRTERDLYAFAAPTAAHQRRAQLAPGR
jgi:outer membrane protein assembly factor BamB